MGGGDMALPFLFQLAVVVCLQGIFRNVAGLMGKDNFCRMAAGMMCAMALWVTVMGLYSYGGLIARSLVDPYFWKAVREDIGL